MLVSERYNPDRPSVPEVMPIVREIYERNAAGCCWHVVLDDENVDDRSVEFCANYARERGHFWCCLLIEPMLKMSKTQRRKLAS